MLWDLWDAKYRAVKVRVRVSGLRLVARILNDGNAGLCLHLAVVVIANGK